MPTGLRIAPLPGIGRGAAHGQIPAPAPVSQPIPLMIVDIEQQTPRGVMIDRLVLWRNEDAERCDWCPQHGQACTFQPGPEGQGNCVVRSQSQASRVFLADLPGDGPEVEG